MATIADHDAYIAAAPVAFRPSLELLRARLARALPDADEIVAYNMPRFTISGASVAKARRSRDVSERRSMSSIAIPYFNWRLAEPRAAADRGC